MKLNVMYCYYRYLKYQIDNENLQDVYLKGEISIFKAHSRDILFTLKDETSRISAIMFHQYN